MAPSPSELAQVRDSLKLLSESAISDLEFAFSLMLRPIERTAVRLALLEGWTEVLEHYSGLASTLATDTFGWQASDIGVDGHPIQGEFERDSTRKALVWALTTLNPAGNAKVAVDKVVKQSYANTFSRSALNSKAGYARVPVGVTCAFCMMLASRGGVYREGTSARVHGGCDCAMVLVRSPKDYPDGYDPDDLYRQYAAARSAAQSGDVHAILHEMRQQQGLAH